MAFHQGTEERLLNYVQANAVQNDPDSVIKVVDEFCWNNHWMMHVGDVKGKIVDSVLKEANPTTILELGTYCGYSAVRMARCLSPGGKLYTIDPFLQPAAKVLIDKAGYSDRVVCLHGLAKDILPTLTELKGRVDLVFIDHEKSAYCSDLLLIEQHQLLHAGSTVVADNVVVFHINDYLNHVRNSGSYESKNILSVLEYSDTEKEKIVDGIEISKYLGV